VYEGCGVEMDAGIECHQGTVLELPIASAAKLDEKRKNVGQQHTPDR
jgi:hypothetical protein